MQQINFITILSALSLTASSALTGIVLLPVDDIYKAFASFFVGLAATFLAGLLKPPTGPQVAANPRPPRRKS